MSAALARVACVIAARDEEQRIAATVTAALTLPGVDLVLVCDDGSTDRTAAYAGAAGAIVVNHSRTRGKAAAVESAVNALGVLEQRDNRPEAGTLLLLDADLGESATLAAPLVTPVTDSRADLTIAVPPPLTTSAGATPGGPDLVTATAARGITELTGRTPRAPLSGQRCLTRRAFELASPLAPGWGMEVGMTIDILRAGLRVEEIEIELPYADAGRDLAGQLHRAALLRDVTRALVARGAVTADTARAGFEGLKDAGSGLLKRLRR